MTTNRRWKNWIAAAALALAASSCAPKDEAWHSFGPEEGEPSLVVVFQRDAPPQEVFRVVTERLSELVDRRTGSHRSLPGVRSLMKIDLHGHTAYALAFRTTSTVAQREFVRARVVKEPSVLGVFQDIDPSAIAAEDLGNQL